MKKLTIILSLFFSSISMINAQQWDTLGSGVKGYINLNVNTLTQYNGNLIVGGIFDSAGGIFSQNMAQWNGVKWDTIFGFSSSPINLWVYAQCIYNDSLIIAGEYGGNFEMAEWNGTIWNGMNTGYVVIQEIFDFAVYQGKLYAGGQIGTDIYSLSDIAVWNGNNWDTLPSGVIKKDAHPNIGSITVYNGNLYIGGNFDTAGNIPAKNIAMWNGSTWLAVGDGFNGPVGCLYVSNGTLYAGGSFDSSGSQRANNIAFWDGSKWNPLGSGIRDGGISSIVNYGSVLCVAGSFDSAGSQRANNIAYWDGTNWGTLGSGVTGGFATAIRALSVYNGALIVAGAFNTAGGLPANNIAQWSSPLGISQIDNVNINVKVYPNPSSGVFTLQINTQEPIGNRYIEVYNMLGQQVYQTNINANKVEINLSGQPQGIYLYRVITETGDLVGEGKIGVQK